MPLKKPVIKIANVPPEPTMQAVADHAGVCLATVSRALKNQPCVAAKTRLHVQRVADELGYRPNPMVSALMAQLRTNHPAKYTPTIGFLTFFRDRHHWHSSPSIVYSYEGAMKRCQQLGFQLEHFWFGEEGMTKERAFKILHTRNIAGVVFAELPMERPVVDFVWDRFSCSSLGFSMHTPQLHRASHDNFTGLKTAYQNLIDLGYRRIGLALRQVDEEHNNQSWIGACGVSQYYHPEAHNVSPFLVETEGWNPKRFGEWFRTHQPDVVLTLHPDPYQWLHDLGLRVPEDVGYACLDVKVLDFPAAGIDQSQNLVGAAAVDLVVEQVNSNERGIPARSKVVLIVGEWCPGPTVRAHSPAPTERKRQAKVGTRLQRKILEA